jgi:hypothetical protein
MSEALSRILGISFKGNLINLNKEILHEVLKVYEK